MLARRLVLTAAVTVALLGAPALANKMSNSSFETTLSGDARIPHLLLADIDWMKVVAGNAGDGQAYVADNGQTNNNDIIPSDAVEGWTVLTGVDWVSSGYWTAEDGDRSLDLCGSVTGGVSQSVATDERNPINPSERPIYNVGCMLSGNPDHAESALRNGVRHLEILVGDGTPTINSLTPGDVTFSGALGLIDSRTFNFDTSALPIPDPTYDNPIPDMGWVPVSFDFELPDNSLAQVTVVFRSLDDRAWGPAIDTAGFEFTGFTPEPGTMSLLMLGGVAALVRRRRRA